MRRWDPVRARRACLFVLLLVAALPASAHAGGPHALKVTVDRPSRLQEAGGDKYLVGTRTPTFHIQAELSGAPAGYQVRCQVDDPPDGPCGTQDPQCPVTQCWTFTASHDSDGTGHQLTVSISSPDGSDTYDVAGLNYDVDTTPPDTKLVPINGGYYPIDFPFSPRRVQFAFDRADEDLLASTFECAITSPAAAAPGSWSKCKSEQIQPQKLSVTSTYLFWVRAIDFLGRPDPTPVSYAFSPTPCHFKLLSHPHKLRAIVQHGIRMRMTCVEPVGMVVDLYLNNAQSTQLGVSPQLGEVQATPSAPQSSKTFTLHPFKGLPKKLFRHNKLFLALVPTTIRT